MAVWWFIMLGMLILWLVTLGLGVLCQQPLIPDLVGGLIGLIGAIFLLVVAFSTSVADGILCMFIPFYALYFVSQHYDSAWKPFCLILVSIPFRIVAFVLVVVGPPMDGNMGFANAPPRQVGFDNQPRFNGRQPMPAPAPFAPAEPPAPAVVPRVTGDERIDGYLADLNDNRGKAMTALQQLRSMEVEEKHQPAVAKRLVAAARGGDHFTRIAAVEALGVWATPAEVSALIDFIGEKDHFVRVAAVAAIVKFREDPAVKPKLAGLGAETNTMNADEFAAFPSKLWKRRSHAFTLPGKRLP